MKALLVISYAAAAISIGLIIIAQFTELSDFFLIVLPISVFVSIVGGYLCKWLSKRMLNGPRGTPLTY